MNRHEQKLKALQDYTRKITVSPETAREALIKSGIYNEDGTLHENYRQPKDKNEH